MKLGLGIRQATDELLRYAKQLGVSHIIVHTPQLPGDGYWEFTDLLRLRTRIESFGLKMEAIENLPRNHYDKLLAGLPGREEQLDKVRKTILNMGRAGIPILGYHWMLVGVWRTEVSPRGRGGARISRYDHELAKSAPLTDMGEVSAERLWDNFTYFLKGVIPVAEEAGVRLGLHPDDPPMPALAGTARIFGSFAAYKRLIELVPSRSNAIEFCQGTFTEMGGDVLEAIRYFGQRDKILYVHFRNVRGAVPVFDEVFIDEGDVDMFKAIQTYKEVGFDGVLIPDHTPGVEGDVEWGYRGFAYALGYMKALLERVGALSA